VKPVSSVVRSDVVAALRGSDAFGVFGLKMVGVDAREEHVLVLIDSARFGAPSRSRSDGLTNR
jgi:hypothetical protein